MEAERFPLDFSALNKGDEIHASKIEQIYNVKRDQADYNIRKMTLAKQIEQAMLRRGLTVTVRSFNNGLRILTDLEASEYNADETKRAIGKMGRCLTRVSGVDCSEFGDEDLRRHDHRVRVVGSVYIAAKSSYKQQIKLAPTQRATPSLAPSEVVA